MRTTTMLTLAAMFVAGTATAASACGMHASLAQASYTTVAAAQDLSAASKKSTKHVARQPMMKRSTTGARAGVNPAGGPGTGTTPAPKSTSTGNAGTGAGAAGGESAGSATNSGH